MRRRWPPCLPDLQVIEHLMPPNISQGAPYVIMAQFGVMIPLHLQIIQSRLGLNPPLCPICRGGITGRATGMENFLKVHLYIRKRRNKNKKFFKALKILISTRFFSQELLITRQAMED